MQGVMLDLGLACYSTQSRPLKCGAKGRGVSPAMFFWPSDKIATDREPTTRVWRWAARESRVINILAFG